MMCHECVMEGRERGAVAICEYCQVFLCKEHLVRLYEECEGLEPFVTCHHQRGRRPPIVAGVPRRAPIRSAG